MIERLCLLLVPDEGVFTVVAGSVMPSLALAVIKGYLTARGFSVDPFDLSCTLKKKALIEAKDDFTFVYSKKSVLDYLNGADDARIDHLLDRLLGDLDLESYDLIGISIGADYSFMQIHLGFAIGKYIQKRYNKPLVFGGDNVSFICQFQDALSELLDAVTHNFKYIVRGPGARALHELIQVLNDGGTDEQATKIAGLVYADADGRLKLNAVDMPLVLRPDFDGLDWSDYENYFLPLTGDEEKDRGIVAQNLTDFYSAPHVLINALNTIRRTRQSKEGRVYDKKIILPYVFNYFCPFNCAFCGQSTTERKTIIIGQAQQVVDDLAYLADRYHTNHFVFFNNAINCSARFVDQFCAEIERRGLELNWSDCGRFNNLTLERLQRLKKAGCRKLVFGFETGSPRLLKLIDKRLDLDQVERVLRWCHEVGIYADLEIIVGLPWEKDEDFAATYNFCWRNRSYINCLTVNNYFVVPESLMGRYPEQYRIEILRDVRTFDSVLQDNDAWFHDMRILVPRPQNFGIYKFDEIDGETHAVRAKKLQVRYDKMCALNSELGRRFLKMIAVLKKMNIHINC